MMRSQKRAQDSQARLGAEGGEHIGVVCGAIALRWFGVL